VGLVACARSRSSLCRFSCVSLVDQRSSLHPALHLGVSGGRGRGSSRRYNGATAAPPRHAQIKFRVCGSVLCARYCSVKHLSPFGLRGLPRTRLRLPALCTHRTRDAGGGASVESDERARKPKHNLSDASHVKGHLRATERVGGDSDWTIICWTVCREGATVKRV
jgi:hypothetical protein